MDLQKNHYVHLAFYCALTLTSPLATAWSQDEKSAPQALEALIRGIVIDEWGSPLANAKIQTLATSEQDSRQTESLRNGAFVLRISADSPFGQALLVTDAAGERAGFVSRYSYKVGDRNPLQVVLRPWKATLVKVIDSQSQPVEGATVYLIADHRELGKTKTDQAGIATLRFPADANVDWVVAYKSSQGFDYYENYQAWPSQERLPVPPQITLNLIGAVSAVIEVVDSDDNPVPSVKVVPWTIETENKISDVNLSGLGIATTNEKGQAAFNWLPRNLKGRITFLVHDEKYHCDVNPVYVLNTDETTTRTARVKRVATVQGTIRHADGSPAAGIRLQGEGRGATNMYFRGYTRSNAEGTYEIDIYPHQETILAVADDRYAAQSATDIELKPGEELKGVDFTLSFGTLIHGKLTVGKDRKPQSGQTATLIQMAGEKSELVRWSESTATGEYRFRVGPGTYKLRLANAEIALTVFDEQQLVHDGHVDRLPRGLISGSVLDDQEGPLANAEVRGESIAARGHAGFKARAQADGTFSSERWNDHMLLYAFDPVRKLAGYKVITPDDTLVSIACGAAGSLTGTVVDADGKPLAKREVYMQFSPIENGGGAVLRERTETDAQGKFTFPAIATGMRGEISAPLLLGRGQMIEFKVVKAEAQELPSIIDDTK